MKIHLKKKPYIIAEIGINHNGYLSLAKKMIRASPPRAFRSRRPAAARLRDAQCR